MSVEAILNRVAIAFCELDYDKFRYQIFSESDLKKFKFGLDIIKKSAGDYIIVDQGMCGSYPEGMIPLLNAHAPEVVIIDGLNLMSDSDTKRSGTDWTGLKGIMNSIKSISKKYALPMVVSSQRSRAGETSTKMSDNTLADIAYGDVLGQFADVVFRLKLEEEMSHIKVYNPKVRESKGLTFYINAYPAIDMNEKSINESDFFV
jgi:hypothetical protein